MNLKYLKYLSHLIFEGEKTSREIASSLEVPLPEVSRAINSLSEFRLVAHPALRRKSWKVENSNPLNTLLDRLLLVSKNSEQIKSLIFDQSVVLVATAFSDAGKELSINQAINHAKISRVTATTALNKLTAAGVLAAHGEKPKSFYVNRGLLPDLFIKTCIEIERTFSKTETPLLSPEALSSQLQADDAVLILVLYGSYARKTADESSDIDLFVVTRDRFDRGEILSKYSSKKNDLNVYSKAGFLQLLKTHPDFVRNLSLANVLKGKDLLEAILA